MLKFPVPAPRGEGGDLINYVGQSAKQSDWKGSYKTRSVKLMISKVSLLISNILSPIPVLSQSSFVVKLYQVFPLQSNFTVSLFQRREAIQSECLSVRGLNKRFTGTTSALGCTSVVSVNTHCFPGLQTFRKTRINKFSCEAQRNTNTTHRGQHSKIPSILTACLRRSRTRSRIAVTPSPIRFPVGSVAIL